MKKILITILLLSTQSYANSVPDHCQPGITPVLCDLKPSTANFEQCKLHGTKMLCDLSPVIDQTQCPITQLTLPKHRRISCYVKGDIHYAVYALMESDVSEFNPKIVTDFDYNYYILAESTQAKKLIQASGFTQYKNSLKFDKTILGPIPNASSEPRRKIKKNISSQKNWKIGIEYLNYDGPNNGIDVVCTTAIKQGLNSKSSLAIQNCPLERNTDEGLLFLRLLNRMQ